MTNLVPEPNWSDVRQLEANEYATGGAGGNMNEQALALTARTGYLDKYTASPYRTGKVYNLNERVQLENGDIVKSTINGNSINPNIDITGWVKINDASQIFDASGKNQQELNNKTFDFIGTSVTPEMFLIVGESTWDGAFQRAQEASNHIILQNGKTYNITKVIHNKSGVTWDLNGATIVNLRTDVSSFNHHAFTLGNMHPACFNYPNQGTGQYLPCFNVSNIPIGSDFVTLSDSSKASRFNVGQFAWVRTTAEVYSSGDANIPNYAQLVKVKKISGANIFFETTISEAIANACISPIGETTDPATGLKWHIVENVTIKNGVLDARYGAWTRTGMYKCVLEDIKVSNGDGTFALNATCHSKLSNITGDFCVRALELKCNSHDTEIFDLNSTFSPKSSVAMLAGLDIGEQSRNIKVYRPRVNVGTDIGGATAIGVPLDVRGRNIQIVDGEFSNCADTPTVTGNVAYIRDAQFEGFGTEGVKLINTKLKGSSKRTHLLRVGDTASSIKAKNTEIDVSYDGQANIAQASYQSEALITKPTAGQAGQVPSNGVSPRVISGELDLNFFNFAIYSGVPELINFNNGKAWGLDKDADEFVVTTVNVPSWATVADITGYFINTANSVGDVSLRLQSATGGRGGTIGTAASFDKVLSNATQNIINAVNFNSTISAASNGVMVIRVGRRGSDVSDTLGNDIGFIGLSVLFR